MADAPIVQEPFYLPVGGGKRFCIRRGPASGARRGVVVHAPAFAEEMNKSRRMTAWCGRDLAALGFEVIQVDPLGCGDSSGDFGDATWAAWAGDIARVVEWAVARYDAPLWLWGLRAGALLAIEALPLLPREASLLLWQPVLAGRMHLTQFLRVATTPTGYEPRGRTGTLHEALTRGESVEVAGYGISPGLASGLAAAELVLPSAFGGKVIWLEVGSSPDEAVSAGSPGRIEELRAQGIHVTAKTVPGPRFWQSVEIEDCPALVEATTAAMRQCDEPRLRRASPIV